MGSTLRDVGTTVTQTEVTLKPKMSQNTIRIRGFIFVRN